MTCCGERLLYTTRHTTVCTWCGLEKACPFTQGAIAGNQNTYSTHAPLVPAYSRRRRFERLFNAVVQPAPQPADEKMIRYLFGLPRFTTQEALLATMKRSPLKDKRYNSTHVMCKLFLTTYAPPRPPDNLHQLRKRVLWDFDEIQFAHRRTFSESHFFFNYCWLLGFCLSKRGLGQFLTYVKPLKCRQRRKVYLDMMTKITQRGRRGQVSERA